MKKHIFLGTIGGMLAAGLACGYINIKNKYDDKRNKDCIDVYNYEKPSEHKTIKEFHTSEELFWIEYQSLTQESKECFLRMVTKHQEQILTESQFWGNFSKLCDYLNNSIATEKGKTEEYFQAGGLLYDYFIERISDFAGKCKDEKSEYNAFCNRVSQSLKENYGKMESIEEATAIEINTLFETYIRNLFILIVNGTETTDKITKIDYVWEDFINDIKNKSLTKRKRILLSNMVEEGLSWRTAEDTFIYTVVALYFVKHCQEKWG